MLGFDVERLSVDPDVLDAQETAKLGRMIIVKGESTVWKMPDTIELTVFLRVKNSQYDEMQKESEMALQNVKNLISSAGFQGIDLQMTHYKVDTTYMKVKRGKELCSELQDYVCNQTLFAALPLDYQKLAAFLNAMDQSEFKPKFKTMYVLCDLQAAKEEALRQATLDAKQKAECIAQAAGVKLGSLVTVKCGSMRGESHTSRLLARTDFSDSDSDDGMRPESIKVEATVDCIWAIEG